MSAFADLHADAIGVVFDTYGAPATRTGKSGSFPAAIRQQNVTVDRVTYMANTAMIYRTDGEFAVNEKLTVNGVTWIIDGVIERGRLTNTYVLRDKP